MIAVLQQKGGIGSGGFNFDAKCRRGSNDVMDLFYAHIGGYRFATHWAENIGTTPIHLILVELKNPG